MEEKVITVSQRLISEPAPEEPIVTADLVEKLIVTPERRMPQRRLFLSNIDLTLVTYYETVTFFGPPPKNVRFAEVADRLCGALSRLLVTYDFVAGRLEPTGHGEASRLEINCNGEGVVVVVASCSAEMSKLGELRAPKPAYKQLVKFLQDESCGDPKETKQKPLMLFQLTELKCGSIALGSRSNHCLMDGIAGHEFQANLAALTRGQGLVVVPNPDRSAFKARDPPLISHPHFEYSKLVMNVETAFSARGGGDDEDQAVLYNLVQKKSNCSNDPNDQLTMMNKEKVGPLQIGMLHLSPKRIARLKAQAGAVTNCTTFHVLVAKIWRARSIAMGLVPDDRVSTVLFPVDVRKRVVPNLPDGFVGNALVPGYARATMRELKELKEEEVVERVKQGIEGVKDEYIKSGIDWLEVHRGVPCQVDSFSVVAWWRLGLDDADFWWGRIHCFSPVQLYPGLVLLLPPPANANYNGEEGGGISICLELPSHQLNHFSTLIMN